MKKILGIVAVTALSIYAKDKDFKLYSRDFRDGDTLSAKFMFNGFGCDGQNLSPELHWQNLPEGTKSLAITVHDPDAPTGGPGWTHWMLFNLPANVQSIAQGQTKLPAAAIQSITDFGKPGFGGYCPPAGSVHRYHISLTALDVERISLDSNAMPALVGFMVNSHQIARAQMIVYGKR